MATKPKAKPLSYAEILEMRDKRADEFFTLCGTYVVRDQKIEKLTKEAKSSRKENGVVLYLLKDMWLTLRETGGIARNKNFAEYHRDTTGAGPNNHAYSCANTFGFAVMMEPQLLSEHDYYACTSEALETTSRIYTKCNDDRNHPAVEAAIAMLLDRDEDMVKDLKNLEKNSLKVEKVTDERGVESTVATLLSDDELAEQTAEQETTCAIESVDLLLRNGKLDNIANTLLAWAMSTENSEDVRILMKLGIELGDMIPRNTKIEKKEVINPETGKKEIVETQVARWSEKDLDAMLTSVQEEISGEEVDDETADEVAPETKAKKAKKGAKVEA
jgi:hypothetical protein